MIYHIYIYYIYHVDMNIYIYKYSFTYNTIPDPLKAALSCLTTSGFTAATESWHSHQAAVGCSEDLMAWSLLSFYIMYIVYTSLNFLKKALIYIYIYIGSMSFVVDGPERGSSSSIPKETFMDSMKEYAA